MENENEEAMKDGGEEFEADNDSGNSEDESEYADARFEEMNSGDAANSERENTPRNASTDESEDSEDSEPEYNSEDERAGSTHSMSSTELRSKMLEDQSTTQPDLCEEVQCRETDNHQTRTGSDAGNSSEEEDARNDGEEQDGCYEGDEFCKDVPSCDENEIQSEVRGKEVPCADQDGDDEDGVNLMACSDEDRTNYGGFDELEKSGMPEENQTCAEGHDCQGQTYQSGQDGRDGRVDEDERKEGSASMDESENEQEEKVLVERNGKFILVDMKQLNRHEAKLYDMDTPSKSKTGLKSVEEKMLNKTRDDVKSKMPPTYRAKTSMALVSHPEKDKADSASADPVKKTKSKKKYRWQDSSVAIKKTGRGVIEFVPVVKKSNYWWFNRGGKTPVNESTTADEQDQHTVQASKSVPNELVCKTSKTAVEKIHSATDKVSRGINKGTKTGSKNAKMAKSEELVSKTMMDPRLIIVDRPRSQCRVIPSKLSLEEKKKLLETKSQEKLELEKEKEMKEQAMMEARRRRNETVFENWLRNKKKEEYFGVNYQGASEENKLYRSPQDQQAAAAAYFAWVQKKQQQKATEEQRLSRERAKYLLLAKNAELKRQAFRKWSMKKISRSLSFQDPTPFPSDAPKPRIKDDSYSDADMFFDQAPFLQKMFANWQRPSPAAATSIVVGARGGSNSTD